MTAQQQTEMNRAHAASLAAQAKARRENAAHDAHDAQQARLIAAAPDLLAACQAIVRYQKLVETDATTGLIAAYAEAFEGAEVAIKKATGDKK